MIYPILYMLWSIFQFCCWYNRNKYCLGPIVVMLQHFHSTDSEWLDERWWFANGSGNVPPHYHQIIVNYKSAQEDLQNIVLHVLNTANVYT